MSASEEQSQGPVIRDRRRIDPVTGQPREAAKSSAAQAGSGSAEQAPRGGTQQRPGRHAAFKPGGPRAGAAGGDGPAEQNPGGPGQPAGDGDRDAAVLLAERTADLQRLQAEYANYRKRVERDRVAVREQALASVLAELLPVLDDIGRAREHDELTGGFKSVADSLESVAVKLGLTMFGEAGDAFDPTVHEALMHSYSPDVAETTCVQILQPGYKVGERILRPARVAVAEPADPAGARPPSRQAADTPEETETETETGGAAEERTNEDQAPDGAD
jgi:molecular chaperone GrpE